MRDSKRSRFRIGRLVDGHTPNLKEDDLISYRAFLRDLQKYHHLGEPEQRALLIRAQQGDKTARSKLIETNLRLIYAAALDFSGRGLSVLELVNEGAFGMYEGIKRFQLDRPVHVMTYLMWWVKQGMWAALYNTRDNVRIPRQRQVDDSTRPDPAETAAIVPLPRLKIVGDSGSKKGLLSPRSVRYVSLQLQHDRQKRKLEEILPSPVPDIDPDDVEEALKICRGLYRRVRARLKVLRCVSERDKQIFRDFYGFGNSEPKTFFEIGKQYGFSKQRTEQIVKRIIRFL